MRPAPDRADRLLVLAPVGRDAELAVRVLRAAELAAERCDGVGELCAELEEGELAGVLVTEEVLSPAALDALAEALRRQEAWSDLPVVVFTSAGRADAGAEPLAVLGNVTVVDRPLRRRTLLSVARAALRARRRQYAAREVLGELRAAVRQRDEFLALLGHELRNPLAAIEMAGQLLERGGDPGRHLGIVRRQTRQLARLVDDLLDVSRVTAGKITLHFAPVDLGALAARAVESHAAAAAEQAGIELRVMRGPGRIFTLGDEARLEQVVVNLVTNAVKYTPRGGHVRVSAERDGAAVILRVADDGVGIASPDLQRIFDPFVQVSASIDRARGGMGLGLTLVRGLVQMHGGSISARSAGSGQGSVFVVRLPAAEAPGASAAARADGAARAREVLVVEDVKDVRTSFVEALELAGHRVRAAPDGFAALAAARQRSPEVAFVDLGLPGLDGYEVARRLRAELGRRPYLVALSGYGRPEDRERSREAGFDLHVTKPVDLGRVEAILAALPSG